MKTIFALLALGLAFAGTWIFYRLYAPGLDVIGLAFYLAVFWGIAYLILRALGSLVAHLVKPLLTWKFAVIAASGIALVVGHAYLADYWVGIVVAGGILLVAAGLLPIDSTRRGGLVVIPKHWNELAIIQGANQYADTPNAIVQYFDNLKARFVIGQAKQTADKRLEFLKTLNEVYEQVHHAGEWERKLGRLPLEQDAFDTTARNENELAQLRADAAKAELRKKIAETEKAMREMNRIEVPATPAPEPTPVVRRAQIMQEVAKLRKEKEQNLKKILKRKKYEDLPPDQQEFYDFTRNVYDNLIVKEIEKVERT